MNDGDEIKRRVSARLRDEQRWAEAMPIRDQLMREARSLGLSKAEAQETTYTQLDERFPPLTEAELSSRKTTRESGNGKDEGEGMATGGVDSHATDRGATSGDQSRARSSETSVNGLDVIPEDWPTLPANASLAAEIQWVQSSRLHCVREHSDRTEVDLSRALAPAPSWSALGWLETSIRAYSKYVDVAAKISSTLEDDRETAKRERLAIDEVRALLAEMLEG